MATVEERKNREFDEEVQCGEVSCPVLPWGCSITQFNSFKYAWDNFSQQYKSRNEQDESQYVINYQLNYQLLDSIPGLLEDEIYKDLGYRVETISNINLLKQIKRVIVTWAIENAQQKLPVKVVAEHAMEVAKEHTVEEVVAVLKDMNNSTLINKYSEEDPVNQPTADSSQVTAHRSTVCKHSKCLQRVLTASAAKQML